MAEFFQVDPTIIRLLFVIFVFAQGVGILAYAVLWILVPTKSNLGDASDTTVAKNTQEIKATVGKVGTSLKSQKDRNSSNTGAILIIALGLFFLLKNLGFIGNIDFGQFWPLAIIGLGAYLLFK